MKIKEEVRSLKSKETEGKTRTFWARKASRGVQLFKLILKFLKRIKIRCHGKSKDHQRERNASK